MFCLIQLYYHSLLRYCAHQTFFSNSDGYFSCSKRLLRKYFGGSESDFLRAMEIFETLGILTIKKDSSKTIFRIKVNTERFSDFDKIPTDVLLANIRSITVC